MADASLRKPLKATRSVWLVLTEMVIILEKVWQIFAMLLNPEVVDSRGGIMGPRGYPQTQNPYSLKRAPWYQA